VQYSKLGSSGLIVSRLAFGTMTFGRAGGIFATVAKVDQAGANELVARAIGHGINFFNSADVYTGGDSERILGRALGSKRKDVVIATKLGNRMSPALIDSGLSYRNVLAACDASLERLGTDYIDVYLVHKVDALTPVEETLDGLEALVRAGKVRYVGFSNWPAWMAAKAVGVQRARGFSQFRAAELYYSLVGRDVEHELQPFAADAGIGLLVWSPLAGGFLSGKYTRTEPKGQSGDRLGGFDFLPYDRERGFTLVDLLKTIGAAHGATAAQVAIAWLLTRSAVASVLIGASTARQLDDNAGAAALELSADDLAQLEAATKPAPIYPHWFTERVVDAAAYEALGLSAPHAIRR
jgi:aryl-alcohol dehydrogenase-like predicted oxidoreductase